MQRWFLALFLGELPSKGLRIALLPLLAYPAVGSIGDVQQVHVLLSPSPPPTLKVLLLHLHVHHSPDHQVATTSCEELTKEEKGKGNKLPHAGKRASDSPCCCCGPQLDRWLTTTEGKQGYIRLGKVKAAEVSLHHPLRGCCKERGAHVADHVHVYGVEWMALIVDLVIAEADLEYVIGSMSAAPA